MLISIDPGLNNVAYALWREKQLVSAGLVKNPYSRDKKLQRPEIWYAAASALVRKVAGLQVMEVDIHEPLEIIMELPKVRQRGSGKGDPNDLIDVAGVAACVIGQFKTSIGAFVAWSPSPEDWKGQLPKEISAQRVTAALSETETQAIEMTVAGLMHNVMDAIHLGLVYLKRS